ncbi:hypothetical protein PR048_025943 [Dryococelus australis]|uniref:Uncharacterized protein n=1 Tax=Dryococelus australis TaxID=614101 RepID=A0ABQ9GK00_9NEOP|nr:hypothetical protein PR048_025943 [Dryococelus australis]
MLCLGFEPRTSRTPDRRRHGMPTPGKELRKLNTISAYTRQKAKSKYRKRMRLERASQTQSSDTHETLYDRVKRCRERKINIKASERVNVDLVAREGAGSFFDGYTSVEGPASARNLSRSVIRYLLILRLRNRQGATINRAQCSKEATFNYNVIYANNKTEGFDLFYEKIERIRYTFDTSAYLVAKNVGYQTKDIGLPNQSRVNMTRIPNVMRQQIWSMAERITAWDVRKPNKIQRTTRKVMCKCFVQPISNGVCLRQGNNSLTAIPPSAHLRSVPGLATREHCNGDGKNIISFPCALFPQNFKRHIANQSPNGGKCVKGMSRVMLRTKQDESYEETSSNVAIQFSLCRLCGAKTIITLCPNSPEMHTCAYLSPEMTSQVSEVSMEQRRNERAGVMGDPQENPPTSGIVWHDSRLRKSGVNRPGIEPVRRPVLGTDSPHTGRAGFQNELHALISRPFSKIPVKTILIGGNMCYVHIAYVWPQG